MSILKSEKHKFLEEKISNYINENIGSNVSVEILSDEKILIRNKIFEMSFEINLEDEDDYKTTFTYLQDDFQNLEEQIVIAIKKDFTLRELIKHHKELLKEYKKLLENYK